MLRFSKTIKDIQWSFVSLAISSIVHFLLRAVLGRELGAYGLGLYTLVFVIYLFGMQFASFGIGAALTKYVAEYKENRKKVSDFASAGLIGSFLIGLIIGLVLFLLSDILAVNIFNSPDMVMLIRIIALCFPFIAIQKIVVGTLNGLRKMKLFAFVTIMQNVSVFLVSFVLVYFFEGGTMGAVIGLVLPTIIISIFSLSLIRYLVDRPKKCCNIIFKQLCLFGVYVVLINSIALINIQIDSLLIGYFLDKIDVGYYAISILLVQSLLLLPQAIQRITTPMIATYHGRKDYENIRELIKQAIFKTFLIILLLSTLIAFFGKFIINIVFTDEFLPAYSPLLILLFGFTIYAPIVSVGSALSSIGKINILFKVSVFNAIINIILNILLIPRYGINGAAMATSTSLIILVITRLILLNKYIFSHKQ